ncbi:MAG: hypothetical protein PQJ61_14840 [Spirochaetales bacterium]|uniref:Uncharacterized protein n=1 Tax=Candidatus Thalassospirochaeta sargassi TaxID=3119039 RepID=A0AAJ1IEZ0_9SPIO|nr:hypothetical protein [Spirochaetales bacterium]
MNIIKEAVMESERTPARRSLRKIVEARGRNEAKIPGIGKVKSWYRLFSISRLSKYSGLKKYKKGRRKTIIFKPDRDFPRILTGRRKIILNVNADIAGIARKNETKISSDIAAVRR